jgi:selenocysteine lyase/cysteine desulfurase
MPGFCDAGSVDRAALAGLAAGLHWTASPERADRLVVARKRVSQIARAVAEIPKVRIHGPVSSEARMPTLAITVGGATPGELADALAMRGVIVSGGLQCAPLAHETLGTHPDGVLRISVGPSNDESDVGSVIDALADCLGR